MQIVTVNLFILRLQLLKHNLGVFTAESGISGEDILLVMAIGAQFYTPGKQARGYYLPIRIEIIILFPDIQ